MLVLEGILTVLTYKTYSYLISLSLGLRSQKYEPLASQAGILYRDVVSLRRPRVPWMSSPGTKTISLIKVSEVFLD